MIRMSVVTAVVLAASTLAASTLGPAPRRGETVTLGGWSSDSVEETVTLSGWFSDKGCAESKLASDDITPNGTICVKKCLEEGAVAVFIDPKARAMYDVKEPATVIDDVGYYLEVEAAVDAKAKTIAIRSVKRLGDVVQMCGRKAKKT
jgi:hypothetical protein